MDYTSDERKLANIKAAREEHRVALDHIAGEIERLEDERKMRMAHVLKLQNEELEILRKRATA